MSTNPPATRYLVVWRPDLSTQDHGPTFEQLRRVIARHVTEGTATELDEACQSSLLVGDLTDLDGCIVGRLVPFESIRWGAP
jgi:hypothetical protein